MNEKLTPCLSTMHRFNDKDRMVYQLLKTPKVNLSLNNTTVHNTTVHMIMLAEVGSDDQNKWIENIKIPTAK